MKLKVTTITIFIFITILIIGLSFLLQGVEEKEYYKASGTITERRSGTVVILTLDENSENKHVDSLEIYSNIFSEGDKLNIKYHKEKNKYLIKEIEPLLKDDSLIMKMESDPTMIRYQEKMLREEDVKTDFSRILAIPDIINNQAYILMKPVLYFKTKNTNYSNETIIKDKEEVIRSDDSFTVFSFENFHDNKYRAVSYEYVDAFEKNAIKFKGLNKGIYILKVAFKNGDMINYVFI